MSFFISSKFSLASPIIPEFEFLFSYELHNQNLINIFLSPFYFLISFFQVAQLVATCSQAL